MTTKWVEINSTYHIIDHDYVPAQQSQCATLCGEIVNDLYDRTLGYNLDVTGQLDNTLCTKCLGIRDEGYVPSEQSE